MNTHAHTHLHTHTYIYKHQPLKINQTTQKTTHSLTYKQTIFRSIHTSINCNYTQLLNINVHFNCRPHPIKLRRNYIFLPISSLYNIHILYNNIYISNFALRPAALRRFKGTTFWCIIHIVRWYYYTSITFLLIFYPHTNLDRAKSETIICTIYFP